MIGLRNIKACPELLMHTDANPFVLINNPMIPRAGFTLRAASANLTPSATTDGSPVRVAFADRQHAAFLSALLPRFLLGRLSFAGEGARCFPSLSPLAGTDGLASLWRKGQFFPFLQVPLG